MTSKLLSINLRRENIKHRLGMILITFFLFFLSMIAFLMDVQNTCGVKGSKFEDNLEKITAMSQPNMSFGMLAVGAAVLLAISSFRYLHSKTEIDFYHSLPVRRRRHLYLMLTNDLVLFTVPLILVSVFRCIVTAAVGYFGREFLVNSLWSLVCYTAVFAVTYLTMSLAMLMSGNIFIGILGFCVFCSYSPIVLYYLYPSLASTFFVTYSGEAVHSGPFDYFSPLSLAEMLFSADKAWRWKEHIVLLGVIALWIVFLLLLNFFLFEKRASEMAGKAMAFPGLNALIRFLLVVPAAIYAGLCLYAVSFTSFKPWIIAGIIIGGFLAHGVIECIYRFDVRGLWSNKRQMLASIAISFAVVGFFWGDISGYDKYLPQEEALDSIVVDAPNVTEGGFWGKERKGVTGDAMKGSLAVLEKIVRENDKNVDIYNNGGIEKSRGFSSYVIRYKLGNGKEVKRQYVLSAELRDELLEQVFDTMEYKKDTYSLYTADWSLVSEVQIIYPTHTETLDMTKEQRSELFRIYLEEYSGLDYKTVRNTFPFGQLMITHVFDAEQNSYYSGFAGMEETETYCIYPSFKKTIKYLKEELKIDLHTSMKDISITHLEVSRYNDEADETESFDIYDEKFINSIKGKLCYGELWVNGMEQVIDTSVDITATISADTGEGIPVYTDFETVELIKKQGTFE